MDQPAKADCLEGIDWCAGRKRWVAYFDILGFSELVDSGNEFAVAATYEACLEEFRYHEKQNAALSFVYFSDTFLIYSDDDSQGILGQLESAFRWFFNVLLQKRIPFRGALSCNEFLADKRNNIFIGKALVEASKYGEKYNWIGLVLAPSAVERFEQLLGPMDERLNYRRWNLPFRNRAGNYVAESGFAYLIGASHPVNGENSYIPVLSGMAEKVSESVKPKYYNSIDFLKHFGVLSTISNSAERAKLGGSIDQQKTS